LHKELPAAFIIKLPILSGVEIVCLQKRALQFKRSFFSTIVSFGTNSSKSDSISGS